MKYYDATPAGNEMAILAPSRYFNLAIEQIKKNEEWLQTANKPTQALLVHVDMYIYLTKRYPQMGRRRVEALDVEKIKTTFYDWYERCNAKIPKKYREGLKENADELFKELEIIKKEQTL